MKWYIEWAKKKIPLVSFDLLNLHKKESTGMIRAYVKEQLTIGRTDDLMKHRRERERKKKTELTQGQSIDQGQLV